MKNLYSVALFLTLVACASGQQKSYPWLSIPAQLSLPSALDLAEWFDADNAVLYQAHALDLIRATMGTCLQPEKESQIPRVRQCASGEKETFPGSNDYIVIHILRWKDLKPNAHSQSVDKQNWYVFNNGNGSWDDSAYASSSRIFGRRNVYLLYVHFNRSGQALYLARYTMTAKKKAPAYLDHFVSLLSLFGVNPVGGGVALTAVPNAVWGGTNYDTYYVPSDLTFLPEMLPLPAAMASSASVIRSAPSQTTTTIQADPEATIPQLSDIMPTAVSEDVGGPQSSSSSSLPPTSDTVPTSSPSTVSASPIPTPAALQSNSVDNTVTLDNHTFDNEGRYHIDFSVAVPIRKISELSYVSTSNSLVPTKVDKQTTFAVFDYHFKAIDTKANFWGKYPYALAGVAVNSQPLHRVLIGVGYGPQLANFYAGLSLVTQSLPKGTSCGDVPNPEQAAAGLEKRTCPAFTIGLNLSVGSVLNSLKSKQSSSSSSSTK